MQIKTFQRIIWSYYKHNKRDLPWRNSNDPYKIYVSEIMLQQTQVSRVINKYPEFIRAFPTFKKLAQAELKDILFMWQGMGYNRRARFMKETAKILVRDFSGIVPNDSNVLKKLPGIGSGTAGSLVAFIYNKPVIFIETNIRRVMIHHFFKNENNISDKEILSLVSKTIDLENPREWYYALMDYGSMLPKQEKTNANRKSNNYVKQNAFRGSTREIRGLIIKFLINNETGTARMIAKTYKKDETTIKLILETMKYENILERVGVSYRISQK
ncbi:A/G-specific adenine glycosylase [Candidatus Parcubacteria bacterium]|jgi:A/G-specific adenine glycosylase|nr:MAG: A/G-specific adenine glycosylase [Candidatus Parcubacteria bacterium]